MKLESRELNTTREIDGTKEKAASASEATDDVSDAVRARLNAFSSSADQAGQLA